VYVGVLYDHDTTNDHSKRSEDISPFTLGKISKSELLKIITKANNGNCTLAEKLGGYHFYVSLDLIQAEHYHRVGAKCGRPNSMTALIAILRTSETDDEVDSLVRILMEVDIEQGESAAQEVVLRRAERTMVRPAAHQSPP
jgi:hypothetical protein